MARRPADLGAPLSSSRFSGLAPFADGGGGLAGSGGLADGIGGPAGGTDGGGGGTDRMRGDLLVAQVAPAQPE